MASSDTHIVCFREASLYWFELWRMLVLWHHKTGDIFFYHYSWNINNLARGWRSVELSSSVIRQRDSSKVMNVIKNVIEAFCPRFVVNKQIDVFSIQNAYIKKKNTNWELGSHKHFIISCYLHPRCLTLWTLQNYKWKIKLYKYSLTVKIVVQHISNIVMLWNYALSVWYFTI